ncbi:hypothetical protein GCM10023186_00610 [Hymenobacter koreensis]|uniref:DUF4249 family protein n=1 Tax=Hymenobacter koreensis TaxID=1084523 RepID=A0ABP8ITT8_9BACT
MVLGALLEAGKPVEVYVGRVTAMTDSARRAVNDAHVELYLDGRLSQALVPAGQGRYRAAAPVFPAHGQIVNLRATAPGFPSVAATDTVPLLFDTLRTTAYHRWPVRLDANNSLLYAEAVLTLPDLPGATFYEIDRMLWGDFGATSDPVFVAEGDLFYNPQTAFFSDRLFRDQTAELRFQFNLGTLFGPRVEPARTQPLVLRTTSRAYYRFRKSWTRHRYNQTTYADDPLQVLWQGEPVNLYTNVQGGYGVVACFAERTLAMPRRP